MCGFQQAVELIHIELQFLIQVNAGSDWIAGSELDTQSLQCLVGLEIWSHGAQSHDATAAACMLNASVLHVDKVGSSHALHNCSHSTSSRAAAIMQALRRFETS